MVVNRNTACQQMCVILSLRYDLVSDDERAYGSLNGNDRRRHEYVSLEGTLETSVLQ